VLFAAFVDKPDIAVREPYQGGIGGGSSVNQFLDGPRLPFVIA
jgi:hypothetical protein